MKVESSAEIHPRLCIGILTLNEEKKIAQCLESARFADQIVVVDGGSRDQTCEVAAKFGAEIYSYPEWMGFAVQRNRLLTHVKADYIFFLDADEVITEHLQTELLNVIKKREVTVGRVNWREVAFGRVLNHMRGSGGVSRLFEMSGLERFDGEVHEQAILKNKNKKTYYFKQPLLHYSRETVYGCLLKMSQYVQLGAVKRAKTGKTGGVLRGIASGLAIFIRLYVFRLGFTGGGPGFLFCVFIALECFFRYAALGYDQELLKVKPAIRF